MSTEQILREPAHENREPQTHVASNKVATFQDLNIKPQNILQIIKIIVKKY